MTGVKQISVFLENQKGALAAVCRALGDANMNLLALSIAETDNFGICRLVLADTDAAVELLRGAGYTVRVSDVMVVSVPDRPCGLYDVLKLFDKEDISVEYAYSFMSNSGFDALLILKLSQPEKAERILRENRVNVVTQQQLDAK